jgi:hypothetical protein
MMIAKARPDWHVTLTDLPSLMPLLSHNVLLNFAPVFFDVMSNEQDVDPILREYLHRCYSDATVFASDRLSALRASVLEWSESDDSNDHETYDMIVAADVVASIYDPIALACTIHRLAHSESTVYLSFKERLSSVHRQFEQKLAALFENLQILSPSTHACRNRNEDVRILVAQCKKQFPSGVFM